MENYKLRLQEQAEALTKDIDQIVTRILQIEEELDEQKQRKSLAFKELRSIEKKLAGIKNPTQSGVTEKDVLGQ